jgi:putative hydrolase of the HAD superfamily
MIKTIIFDLGNVIVPFDFQRGYGAIASHCSYSPAEIPKRIGGTDLVVRFESGQIGAVKFVQELSELLGLTIDFEEFCRIWNSIFYTDRTLPESLFVELKRRHRLVLLSNTNILHFPMLQNSLTLLRQFDAFVLSYEVGILKPAQEIYRKAINAARCQPEECFYIDDIQAYVDGARQAGIDAVQFRSLEKLMEDLRSRNIDWDG